MESKTISLSDALYNIRKAHRLIYSYEDCMIGLVKFISQKIGFGGQITSGKKLLSSPIEGENYNEKLKLNKNELAAWDFIYTYAFEYYIGRIDYADGRCYGLSVLQYTDTGFYESRSNNKRDIDSFKAEKDSSSKLILFLEDADPKRPLIWDNEKVSFEDKSFVNLTEPKSFPIADGIQIVYPFYIEQFGNAEDATSCLNEFIEFCNKEGVGRLKLI